MPESLLAQVERHERELAELRETVGQLQAPIRWLSDTVNVIGETVHRLEDVAHTHEE